MTDHERALGALVHDLRTPLGVASGYVRLVRDGRLPQNTDPTVLLDRALEALRTISRLCLDADRWLDAAPPNQPAMAPSAPLLAMLTATLASRNITLTGVEGVPAGQLRVVGDAGELADAVAEVLSSAARLAAGRTAPVECASLGEELVLIVRDADGADGTRAAFDPWRCPGLQTAIACRTIVRAGGRWTSEGPERLRAAFSWAHAAPETADSAPATQPRTPQ